MREYTERWGLLLTTLYNDTTITMKLTTLIAIFLTFLVGIHAKTDDEPKLRIGITKKVAPENCPRKARNGDVVALHYTGKLQDGSVFDSSYKRDSPIEFPLGVGRVIQGWDQGVLGMCIGEKRKLTIPSHLGYGKQGAGNVIPPDATLYFTTELVSINGETDYGKSEL